MFSLAQVGEEVIVLAVLTQKQALTLLRAAAPSGLGK
jgi:hypothetical protein